MWITLDKDLPKLEVDVLLTIERYEDEYEVVTGYMTREPYKDEPAHWFMFDPQRDGYKVTAWQHLPEPYDPEDEW